MSAFTSYLPCVKAKDVLCTSRTPLMVGQAIIFRALCSDGSDSDDVFGIVFAEHESVPRCYNIRVLAAQNGYYRWHVFDRPGAPSLTALRLPRSAIEADTYQAGPVVFENATRWRSAQGDDGTVLWDLVPWLAKTHHDKLATDITMFRQRLSTPVRSKVRSPSQFRNVVVRQQIRCLGKSIFRNTFGVIFSRPPA